MALAERAGLDLLTPCKCCFGTLRQAIRLLDEDAELRSRVTQALAAGASSVLLDNFTLAQLRQAVALTAGRALLEASGGVSEATHSSAMPGPPEPRANGAGSVPGRTTAMRASSRS